MFRRDPKAYRGEAYIPAVNGTDSDSRNTFFVDLESADPTPRPFTASHEMLHVVADKKNHDTSAYSLWNLLREGTDSYDMMYSSKRISTTQHQTTRTENEGLVLQPSVVP